MDINGGNASRLTNDEGTEGSPRWSPDGQKIVFDSDRAGNADVYVMNADGGSVRVLTSGPEGELMADWSPDGTKIVYAVALAIGPLELFVMNADGSEKRQITMGGGLKVYPSLGRPSRRYALRAIQHLHCLRVRQVWRDGHLSNGTVRQPRCKADQ